jgi:hypothetical protein
VECLRIQNKLAVHWSGFEWSLYSVILYMLICQTNKKKFIISRISQNFNI